MRHKISMLKSVISQVPLMSRQITNSLRIDSLMTEHIKYIPSLEYCIICLAHIIERIKRYIGPMALFAVFPRNFIFHRKTKMNIM